jgi:putative transposase
MGREHRPRHAGLFHVTSRSIAGEHVFASTADYVDGVHQIARLVADSKLRCHGFCLMPTHYHLVASFDEDGLAAAIHLLNRRYATAFNKRHDRRGHVFDSPYRAVEVRDQRHLLVLAAYLAHNPSSRLEWPWGSYPGLIGALRPFSFVDPTPFVDAFGSVGRLRRFVESWQPQGAPPRPSPAYRYQVRP